MLAVNKTTRNLGGVAVVVVRGGCTTADEFSGGGGGWWWCRRVVAGGGEVREGFVCVGVAAVGVDEGGKWRRVVASGVVGLIDRETRNVFGFAVNARRKSFLAAAAGGGGAGGWWSAVG
nr:hypothetical protein [Tanacetum cinerariifolium]